MAEQWINAHIEVIVPLDLPVDATHEERLIAAGEAADRLNLPADVVAVVSTAVAEGE